MEGYADRNRARSDRLVCFAGGGAYDHEIPSVTRALAGRSEFVTSYTPYQPEVAQGVLQAVFEFQTMVARLTGLPVANASLYDGGSAAVEAVNLGVAASGRDDGVGVGRHPSPLAPDAGHLRRRDRAPAGRPSRWPTGSPPGPDRTASRTIRPGWSWSATPTTSAASRTWPRPGPCATAPAPCWWSGPTRWRPASSSRPGEWGADVVVGEGQAFGTTLGFGGPYLGLFACTSAHVRRLPGRLVGETVDVEGRRAYVTTLRAREQDIRREKATSNVCTNQTLMAVTAAIQLGWLGTAGLAELARRCAQATRYTRDALLVPRRVEPYAGAPVLREFALRLPIPASVVIERMADAGFLAGIALGRGVRRRGARAAGRGDRAPDPGRDRRLRDRLGQGGGLMTETAAAPARASRRGQGRPAHRCWAREPSPHSSSCPIRAAAPGRSAPPASPRSPSTSWSPTATSASDPVAAGRGVRARPGGPLHPALPPAVLGGPRRLPARLVHHEVQPQGLRHGGRPARPGRRPPGGAGLAAPRGGSGCWSSWRRSSARSPGWPPPPCSRPPAPPAS